MQRGRVRQMCKCELQHAHPVTTGASPARERGVTQSPVVSYQQAYVAGLEVLGQALL